MSFFGKLKSKLFKSSAKLEEGLDAIVQEDVVPEDILEDEPSVVVATDAVIIPEPEPEPEPERLSRWPYRRRRQKWRLNLWKLIRHHLIPYLESQAYLDARRVGCWTMICWSSWKSC